MRTHLPECPFADADHDALAVRRCICTRLRVCEARVREDERDKAATRLSQHWQETVGRGEPTVAEDELAAVLGTESPTVLHRRVGGCIPHYDAGYAAALRDAIEAVKAALPVLVIDPGVPGFDPSERKAYQIGARYGVAKAAAAIEALGGER